MKHDFLKWLKEDFFPWINWFMQSLINGVMFIVFLGMAFGAGVYFSDSRMEKKSVVELCIKAFSSGGTNSKWLMIEKEPEQDASATNKKR
mgnify:CR=1 FL=1|tara:strand:+ start:212 stop:481 length:270 start_codon:yes stop_codon:yes gene_type:complete